MNMRLVMVGTDKPEKDWPTAEKAYILAKRALPTLEFIRVKNLPHDQVIEVLKGADIFMLTSKSEGGNSLALMDAMSLGKPCIVSDVGGFKDVIEDKKNGLLVSVGDADGFAEAILALAASPELRATLGTAAKKTAQLYSWRNTALAYEDVFRSVMLV
jgi:glycosyltransferase involved in cell wall biosynthesis